jgi:hypothetical protein
MTLISLFGLQMCLLLTKDTFDDFVILIHAKTRVTTQMTIYSLEFLKLLPCH